MFIENVMVWIDRVCGLKRLIICVLTRKDGRMRQEDVLVVSVTIRYYDRVQ